MTDLVRLEDVFRRRVRPPLVEHLYPLIEVIDYNQTTYWMIGEIRKAIERLILVVEQNLGLLGRTREERGRFSTTTR